MRHVICYSKGGVQQSDKLGLYDVNSVEGLLQTCIY